MHYDQTSHTWSLSSAFAQVRPGRRANEEGSHPLNHTLLPVAMDIDSSLSAPPQKFDNVYNINDNSPEMQDLETELSFSSRLQSTPEAQNPSATITWSGHAPVLTKVANKMLLRNYTVR